MDKKLKAQEKLTRRVERKLTQGLEPEIIEEVELEEGAEAPDELD